jgi:hypothetical protein
VLGWHAPCLDRAIPDLRSGDEPHRPARLGSPLYAEGGLRMTKDRGLLPTPSFAIFPDLLPAHSQG